jgi:hypothetical protein
MSFRLILQVLSLLVMNVVSSQSPMNLIRLDSGITHQSVLEFNNDIDQFKVFITSEYHSTKGNHEVWRDMVEYLYVQEEVSTIIMEYPLSHEAFFNAYILNGNSDSLNMMKAKGGFNRELKNEMEFLRGFNESHKRKLIIKTVDVEYDCFIPIQLLQSLLPKIKSTGKIKDFLVKLRSVDTENRKKKYGEGLLEFMRSLEINIAYNQNEYANYLGDDYNFFRLIVSGTCLGNYNIEPFIKIITPESIIADSIYSNRRENFIYQNFTNVIKSEPKGKFVGQFGKAHCNLTKGDSIENNKYWESLAYRLQNRPDSPVLNKVCTFNISYVYCRMCLGQDLSSGYWLKNQTEIHENAALGTSLFKVPNPKNMGGYRYLLINRW